MVDLDVVTSNVSWLIGKDIVRCDVLPMIEEFPAVGRCISGNETSLSDFLPLLVLHHQSLSYKRSGVHVEILSRSS
jgi:hypothetical protein